MDTAPRLPLGRLCFGDTAFPIQPPPLRGTSFHRKEEVSTRAPSFGRGCRAQRGGVDFLSCGEAASSLPSPLGASGARVLSQTAYLRQSFPLVFHAARTLSGSLRSPPSPRGEGFVSGIAVSPSNLRPFGAPPSRGRREYPRETLPLEGADERSEAGLASFFAAKPPPLCFPHGERLCPSVLFFHICMYSL